MKQLRWLGVAMVFLVWAGRAAAQDTVRVQINYRPGVRPGIVVLPAPGLDSMRAILRRDFDYSDRFEVLTIPDGEVPGAKPGAVNYPLYRTLGASLALELVPAGGGQIAVRLHDLGLEQVKNEGSVALDPSGIGESRMAIHRVADDVLRWATGLVGTAATRVLFLNNGDKRIYRVDSDGYGLAPVTPPNVTAISPAWSPDGTKFAYTQLGGEGPGTVILQSMGTGTRLVVPTTNQGQNITPAFSPDGKRLVFSRMTEQSANLNTVNIADLCCAERITAARFAENLSPAYSPDGRRIVFVSTRTGAPQIYVMSADGTDQELFVPFDFGATGNSYAPDWSPDGATIAFHRDVSGSPQIFAFDVASRAVRKVTSDGRNEDPSWAPDGRHLVFVSNRTGRGQLHVLDVDSGRIRLLATPGVARLPAWSRPLARAR